MKIKICAEDLRFEDALGVDNFSDFVKNKINSFNFEYVVCPDEERQQLQIKILEKLKEDLVTAGAKRAIEWEKGWAENLNEFETKNVLESIVPKYFGKIPYVRFNGNFIRPISKDFEYNMLKVIQYWLFEKYFKIPQIENIYEFGCGTGHNLLRVREINPTVSITGLDWAESSQELIELLNQQFPQLDARAENFDFLNPNYSFQLKENSAIYTVAALEQVGPNHDKFINYILNQPVKVLCVHIEPIEELLNPEWNMMDYLSVSYFKKRNYLSGFLTALENLEAQNKIRILQKQRTNIGSFYIEGYSVVVWEKI